MSLLTVEGLCSGYGSVLICNGIDLEIGAGEVVAVLGRNGVGKTTLLKTILGLVPLASGSVVLGGRDVSGWRPDRIARAGMGYVPQGRQLFGNLSVRDNLRVGSIARTGRMEEPSEDILGYFPVLRDRMRQSAGTLSGGEQQMLAIARVLLARPRLLVCDEPSEGIQPSIIEELGRALRRAIEDLGMAVLLVEQNIRLAGSLARRGYVIEGGTVVREGPIEEITSDESVSRHVAFSRMGTAGMTDPPADSPRGQTGSGGTTHAAKGDTSSGRQTRHGR
jgi:branched-chain amino acid transport system ATP-binding protein